MPINSNKLKEIPLFPLNVNLLPEGFIPLQIFEPRYIDMVKLCMSDNFGFVVVLDKYEVGERNKDLSFHSIGTYVEIVDFDKLDNGLLGITAKGKFRVKVLNFYTQEDGLNIAQVEQLEEENSSELKKYFNNIWKVLKEISEHPEIKKMNIEIDFTSSTNVIYNLSSLLPLSPLEKQEILEASSDKKRLEFLDHLIVKFGGGSGPTQDLQA
ncbi:MAG: LON peptidase substrate-binding domain-containing protein [SAR86 cluster bacterium]|nr:LON peptidase substrate-binding domain-containing protein [SAR86 cluster bacterium]